ncbi:MAG: alpha/beta hydrolase [Nannocystaceae bacterium]
MPDLKRILKKWTKRLGVALGVLLALAVVTFIVAYLRIAPAAPVPATVADDPSLPRIELNGVALHVESFGAAEDPVIIVLHGGPGGDYRNLRMLAALADDGYRVVFYDQRGSGLSARLPADQITFQSMLDDLDAIVDRFGEGRPVALIGHSWGAMLTAYYLAQEPEKVARAVLAEPGVLTDEEYQQFAAAFQPPMTAAALLHMARAWIASLHLEGPDDQAQLDSIVDAIMQTPTADNPMNAYWCGGAAPEAARVHWRVGGVAMQAILDESRQADGSLALPPLAVAYPGEVLLIASRCNQLIGVERQTAHRALFPSARLVIIEDAGHLMFTDQPATSLAVLREYLAGWPRPDDPRSSARGERTDR